MTRSVFITFPCDATARCRSGTGAQIICPISRYFRLLSSASTAMNRGSSSSSRIAVSLPPKEKGVRFIFSTRLPHPAPRKIHLLCSVNKRSVQIGLCWEPSLFYASISICSTAYPSPQRCTPAAMAASYLAFDSSTRRPLTISSIERFPFSPSTPGSKNATTRSR